MTNIELKDGSKYQSSTDVYTIDKQIKDIFEHSDLFDIVDLLFIFVNIGNGVPDKPMRIKISEIKTYYTV